MSNYPALPALEGDIMLDIYTHRSMLNGINRESAYGDTERLAELGASVFDMIVTYNIFSERPMLNARDLTTKKECLTAHETISQWLSYYGLEKKVRCTPEVRDTLGSPEETRFLFHSYIGALYTEKGFPIVYTWISRLISPDSEPPPLPGSSAISIPASSAPTSYGSAAPPQPYQPPPAVPPPPTTSSAPSTGVLAVFNQTMTQRGLTVEWPAESTGPPHQPRWVVRCIVNGEEKGDGIGRSQKVAKEEAAKKAFVAMGFGSF
ncbi:hypothetical protein BV22DRAFT_1028326 [Leucogyrophana mollusca]|uniref:Uncharacterized protein n=1 Tax=Leucogyrophana mollusca TaxID=85980 RepID=A0ACB8BXC7_9AGAM|nr:hypothetical protein BV22DRAFT_1028326 [Leucogyrophana mollusca]